MSTPSELWKTWEGRVVDEKFPLRQWLGGSAHSAVFLTELAGGVRQKAAIKLVAAGNIDEESQLSRWVAAAKLSHPNVIQLFDGGRCVIDGTQLLYVVMEYADEDLGQILPLRPLSPVEASEMLRPAAETLASLHRSGWAHGSVKPSNIMAVANHLKLSADSLGKIGDRPDRRVGAYDPPEMATKGPSPAGDVWSIAATLLAVLTQNEPSAKNGKPKSIAIPKTIPQPFLEIARECLRDEAQRCTAEDILRRLQPPVTVVAREPAEGKVSPAQEGSKRWIVLTIVAAALVLGVWLGIRILSRQTPVPAADSRNAAQSAPADVPAEQTPAPFSRKQSSAQNAVTRGSVVQQVLPEVSRSAQNTITGRVKVSVQVSVDASGNVSQAKLVSAGPSRYFADRALEAARRWKFAPPQVDGKAAASEWLLRFQIGRASIQVFPTETKP